MLAGLVRWLDSLFSKAKPQRGSAPSLRTGSGEAETVLLQKCGKYWNHRTWFDRPDGVVEVTTRRFVFEATVPSDTSFLSFPLEQIEDLRVMRVWFMVPAVRFQAAGQDYVFTFLMNAGAIVQAIDRAQKART